MGTSTALWLALRMASKIALLEKNDIASGATEWSSAIVRTHYVHEALVRMALRARTICEQFDDVIGGKCRFRRTGYIAMAGVADVETLEAKVAMHRRIGIEVRLLMPDDLTALEPRLKHAGAGAAARELDSGHADGHTTTASCVTAARRQVVEILTGVSVRRILTDARGMVVVETSGGSITARYLEVAAAYRSRELLARLGVDIHITPVRHAIAIVQCSGKFGSIHPTISDRMLGSCDRPEGAELTLIGTTAPYGGHAYQEVEGDRPASPGELQTLSGQFLQRFPADGSAALRGGYTGVYDCSPDLQPLLGPVPSQPGLHLAAGFSGHGFKLSPVIGELMAENIMTGRTTLVDLDIFSPNRFIENRPITAQHTYWVQTLS